MDWSSSRGQAFLEMSVIGTIALLALTLLIQIGLRQNFQQEIEQQTFREAQRIAKLEGGPGEESQAIQFTQIRDRQVPDPAQGFITIPRTSTQASAAVTWGEWLTRLEDNRASQPRVIVNLNGSRAEFRSEDIGDGPLVSRIERVMTSGGSTHQDQSGSQTTGNTTETTTVTLNTTGGAALSSTLSSPVSFDW